MLAQLDAQEARTEDDRFVSKVRLVKTLYERGHSREDIIQLFRFIDWLLILPRELELKVQEKIEALEKGKAMPYVTSIERIANERGLHEGLFEAIKTGLEVRFGKKSQKLLARVRKITEIHQLRKFYRILLKAETTGELETLLEKK